ncbi:hypothetical protein HanPI659440_Chr14g0556521 [Helianthus annuus]|nr:hypothetical protein HanPI659440_Chr14g0556521 [Helianthus annuus]
MLYADFFREGNFRLPMSKFIGEVLTGYSLHISQINCLGLPRLTHFEFICRANRVEPTFEKFNTFYFVTYTGGFYSFNSRTGGIKPCSRDPPKSLHDWKQKFFYICRGVIPIDMHYRPGSEGIPRVNFEEIALVAAGMSMLWAPQNPRGFPVYGYKGKAGYNLMNIFYSKAGGAMVVAALPEGRPLWLDQIRDNFLYPSNESLATYANTILGDDGEDDIDFDVNPTREEPILLSSEESDDASFHLIRRSSRRDPDDDATLTELVKKRKILEDKKRELDAQAAAALSQKKSKLMKESTAAPSESEIDFGVFSEKTGNRLEKIFKSSFTPRASSKSVRSGRKIDISKITPPASPPSKPLDLSPPRPDPKGKGKEDDVEVDQTEKVVENVAAGAGRDEVHAEGVETEVESSEATPQHTVYPKRVRGSGGGGTSGTHQSPEFHRVHGGSWTTHNPACDDLPHAPHWTLTQGSRMDNLPNCCEFYSLSLPPPPR